MGVEGERLYVQVVETSLGKVLVAGSAAGVAAILIGDDEDALRRDLADRFPRAAPVEGGPEFDALAARVAAAVERPGEPHELPLDLRGTAFQRRVWDALGRIPHGATLSYAELARAVGAPGGSRAVAGACAANAHAVAVPCHRVVRSDGALAGYRWGVERKRALLRREGALPDAAR